MYLLILISQHTEGFAAPHGMKNMSGLSVNKVVHGFKHIPPAVKAGQKIFVIVSLKETVKEGARKHRANVGFRDTMFERRLIEKIVGEHTLILPQDRRIRKGRLAK
jgi:hypothetical protein